jgi:hypothetical protein
LNYFQKISNYTAFSIDLKALLSKNGVDNVVINPIITSMEKISVLIIPALYAMFAITNSIIPLAFNPMPKANETLWFNLANRPPMYPPIILDKKETAIIANNNG